MPIFGFAPARTKREIGRGKAKLATNHYGRRFNDAREGLCSNSREKGSDKFAMKMMLKGAGSNQDASSAEEIEYDLIVVGSGNGACALLSECLKYAPDDYNILVLEEGQNFFQVSDTTHENGWSKTYSTGRIFKLHNTVSPKGKAIISGRAIAMGGGGSINYTMMFESSKWLSKNLGKSEEYWDTMKKELGVKFDRPDPFHKKKKDFADFIEQKAVEMKENPFAAADKGHNIAGNIPSLQDDWEDYPTDEAKQIYIFPTQFNEFGSRTNSGISLVDWTDHRIEIKCLHSVKELDVDVSGTCKAMKARNVEKNKDVQYSVKQGGKVVLCGGSASPRLLKRCKNINNEAIGKYVKDHICMPLGIYFVADDKKDLIGPKNNYESLFATTTVKVGDDGDRSLCTFDFFSGELDRLVYLVSSLYLTYIPFNGLKRLMGRYPFLFTLLSNTIRVLLNAIVFISEVLIGIKDVITFQGWGATKLKVTTSLLKFNPEVEGQYEFEDEKITLGFFDDKKDFLVAEKAIKDNLSFLESLGSKPILPLRWIFQFITKIPYDEYQVKRYVKNFSKRTILSEQHLAGGCLFGKVIDMGDKNPLDTGKVIGTDNLYVADLSTVSVPRVSTQMTAYLIGHYVGNQLFDPERRV